MRRLLDINDTYCLRGIAMLMIIISHTFNGYPVGSADVYYPSWMNWLHMELWGGMGVAVFLFLSGYGLFTTLSQKQRIDWRYISSKGIRLFEPYFIYWIVEIIVLAIFCREEISTHLLTEIATFSIHPDAENWFFKVIVVFYVIMLLLFRVHLQNAVRMTIVSLLSIVSLLIMKELGFGQWWWNNILCFPLGMLFAYKYQFFSGLPSHIVSLSSGALLLTVYNIHMNTIVFHLVFAVFCIYTLKLVNIQSRLLYFIGFNCFIFYFIECPVMDTIMMFAYPNFPVYSLLSVLGTFIISYLCIQCSKQIKSQGIGRTHNKRVKS